MKLMQNYVYLQDRMKVISEHQCFNHQHCTDTGIRKKRQFPKHENSACELCPGLRSLLLREKPLTLLRN